MEKNTSLNSIYINKFASQSAKVKDRSHIQMWYHGSLEICVFFSHVNFQPYQVQLIILARKIIG